MQSTETNSLLQFGNTSLSAGELILSVINIYTGTFGKKPDLAMVNLLVFLIEGDGGVQSDVLFSNTPYGPKSIYLHDFIMNNRDLVTMRVYGRKPANSRVDSDTRKKLDLTTLGSKISNLAINSLSQKDMKTISSIISKWGMDRHPEILTYICVFYEDFCTNVERVKDE